MPHVFTNNFTYDKYMMRTNEFDDILVFKLIKYLDSIRPDIFQISGKSSIRPDSKNHYPVHPYKFAYKIVASKMGKFN